ncbi:papilin isoform X2 [Rhipicephalus sanguineus]|uniref:papilin isoform X2 n=1 Tax=Rhipicephalus sanguineus TaxID=34632 RepID=UPI0018947671|nr:papilin isoform X2 [Rhipicephalus sanguineus]
MKLLTCLIVLLSCAHYTLVPSYRKLVCSLTPKPGPCSALNRTWVFDSETGFCKNLGAKICGTNSNAFPSCKTCTHRCSGIKQFIFKYCMTSQTARVCREHAQSWGIDFVTRACKLFSPDTCTLTNQTKFVSEKACQHMCVPPPQRKLICSLMPKPGPCSSLNKTWYFDPTSDSCKSFVGAKCGANPNAFPSCKVCSHRCSHSNAIAVCGLPHHPQPKPKKKEGHAERVERKHGHIGPD